MTHPAEAAACCANCKKRNDMVLTAPPLISPHAAGFGACHHYTNSEASVFWITHDDEWCGEHEPVSSLQKQGGG